MKLYVDGQEWIVDFQHDKASTSPEGASFYLSKLDNGASFCWIYKPGSKKEADCRAGFLPPDGSAFCHLADNFNKRTGRKIAFTRAIEQFPREERKLWWEAYFATMPKDKKSF